MRVSERKHGDDDPKQMRALFNPDEIRALYGKFKTARAPRPDVTEQFESISSNTALRQGKNDAKFQCLVAWVKDFLCAMPLAPAPPIHPSPSSPLTLLSLPPRYRHPFPRRPPIPPRSPALSFFRGVPSLSLPLPLSLFLSLSLYIYIFLFVYIISIYIYMYI